MDKIGAISPNASHGHSPVPPTLAQQKAPPKQSLGFWDALSNVFCCSTGASTQYREGDEVHLIAPTKRRSSSPFGEHYSLPTLQEPRAYTTIVQRHTGAEGTAVVDTPEQLTAKVRHGTYTVSEHAIKTMWNNVCEKGYNASEEDVAVLREEQRRFKEAKPARTAILRSININTPEQAKRWLHKLRDIPKHCHTDDIAFLEKHDLLEGHPFALQLLLDNPDIINNDELDKQSRAALCEENAKTHLDLWLEKKSIQLVNNPHLTLEERVHLIQHYADLCNKSNERAKTLAADAGHRLALWHWLRITPPGPANLREGLNGNEIIAAIRARESLAQCKDVEIERSFKRLLRTARIIQLQPLPMEEEKTSEQTVKRGHADPFELDLRPSALREERRDYEILDALFTEAFFF